MKTCADLKRRLVVGVFIVMTYHRWEAKRLVGKRRKIVIRQTNAIALETDNNSGLSWLYFPPARNVKITGEDTFSIVDDDGTVLTSYEIMGDRI